MNWKSLAAAVTICTLAFPAAAFAAETPEAPEAEAPAAEVNIEKVVANCTSEPYGKAIHSFTYYVDSTADLLGMTAEDFTGTNLCYDAMEYKEFFDAQAEGVTFTPNTITVEVPSFYPNNSYGREGYWAFTCTNPAFNVDATMDIEFSDPVVESFEEYDLTYGDARLDTYLYTPEGAEEAGPLPLVVFNSGGSGISTTNDIYGANFLVSFAKPEAQDIMKCYALYPQRNEGEVDDLCAAIAQEIERLIEEGKVDADRVFVTGESAGSMFTMNFVSRYPGLATGIVIFDGGYNYDEIAGSDQLEDTVLIDGESPWSDAELQQLADSGTKVMMVQSIGDTTSTPIRYATAYTKLVEMGMTPDVDIFWHLYTAEDFNALLGDNTHWDLMQDGGYISDPITGVTTYYYPEGKLHNSSYPGANDQSIKLWMMNQSKAEYSVEPSELYSAVYDTGIDYSILPDKYTQMAVLENAPGIPAGTETTLVVWTDEEHGFYYVGFSTFFTPEVQFCEGIVIGGTGHTVMDCNGTWWDADMDNFILPYICEKDAAGEIEWTPYDRENTNVEEILGVGESEGGESAEGESAEGESAEGESAEGESAEGESAEGESPAGEAEADAEAQPAEEAADAAAEN